MNNETLPSVDKSLVDFATTIAQEAGAHTLETFQSADLAVEGKGDGTPVTATDRGAERLLRQRISEAFPDDAIVGEEEADTEGTSGRTWILDPIDGTESFIRGVPLYGNLIAMEDQHGPAVGVINIPGLGECVSAGRGKGCFLNGTQVHVSNQTTLEGACLVTSGVDYWPSVTELEPFIQTGTVVRTWGDAYGYVLVATGRADAMIDPLVNRWDVAPMLTIFPEAGGLFTDFSGNITAQGGSAIAANPSLHQAIIKTLNS